MGWHDDQKHRAKLLLPNFFITDNHLLRRKRLKCFPLDVANLPLFPTNLRPVLRAEKKLRSCLCVHDAHRISVENFMAHYFVGHFPQNVNFVANSSGKPPDSQRTNIILINCKTVRRPTYCDERPIGKHLHAVCVDQC